MSVEKKTKPLPLSQEDLAFWRTEQKDARRTRTEFSEVYGWKENLERYLPKPAKTDGRSNADINIGVDFADVERKKAALFYDKPDIGLSITQDRPLPPAEGMPPLQLSSLVSWHQELLNSLLGPQHANIKPTVLRSIFNCLCPSGVGPVTVGYQVTMGQQMQSVPVMDELGNPVMEPVPALAQVGELLGIPAPMPKPLMQDVPVDVPIYERWFVSDFSPMALLIPASYKSTDFARAPWLGKDFKKPASQVRREYNLPKDWKGGTADDTVKVTFEGPSETEHEESAGDPYVTGSEIYYRKQLRSDKEEHPDALMHLVLLDGHAEPLVHRPCPYQDFSELGEMTPDSIKSFTDIPLVLRELSDSAWIPSDCAVTAQLTKELEKFRGDSVKQRQNSKRSVLYDAGKLDPVAREKIENGSIGTFIPVQPDALMQGKDAIMMEVAQPSLGRENFIAQDMIMSDREKILGIGANQTGNQSAGRKTATEQSIVQRNSEARFEQERQKVLAWYLDVVAAFDTLVIRYADARIASQILGPERGQGWAAYKGNLAGGYRYTLQVDSGKYLDVEADRRQVMQLYGQIRQDPQINPELIIKELAEKWGYDPAQFFVPPKPPQKELKASLSVKAEDLNPSLPQFALMVNLLRQGGWQISESDVQMAQQQASAIGQGMLPVSGVGPDPTAPQQAQHGGLQQKAPNINQHLADLTGEQSGPPVDA